MGRFVLALVAFVLCALIGLTVLALLGPVGNVEFLVVLALAAAVVGFVAYRRHKAVA